MYMHMYLLYIGRNSRLHRSYSALYSFWDTNPSYHARPWQISLHDGGSMQVARWHHRLGLSAGRRHLYEPMEGY